MSEVLFQAEGCGAATPFGDTFSRFSRMSNPPPKGIYVPAVLFFKENEELDEEAIKSHVLRLAQVPTLDLISTLAPSL